VALPYLSDECELVPHVSFRLQSSNMFGRVVP